MWRFVLALVVLAGAGGGAWWLVNDDEEGAQAAATPRAAHAAATQPASRPAPAPELAPLAAEGADNASSLARSVTAPPPPPPDAQGLEDGERTRGPAPNFDWKYGQWDDLRMAEQLARVEGEFQQALDREILPRFERGQFVEHAIRRDDRRPILEILAEYGSDDPLCRVWPVLDPSGASEATAQQQLIAVRVVCLPRSEFARLAELADERDWLRGRVHRQQR